MIAYALQGVIFLLLALMIVLMVCGVLYIREHLASAPDGELPDGNMEPDDPALSEPPIVPIEPAIPGEITIPDWIVQDILQRYNQLSSQREKRLLYYRAVI